MNPQTNSDDDVEAIRALGNEYYAAANVGDVNRCNATMAPDVIVMPPERASIIGIDEVRRASSEYHATHEVSYNLIYDEITVCGDIAVARSTATGTRSLRSDGGIENLLWRNLWVLKRQPDGTWKFWRIMFNRPSPAE
jgi:ketosteroid isomerase-like protein